MRWFLCFCILALAVSCSARPDKQKVEKPQARMVSMDEALGELPCFRCHSYQKFTSRQKGVFSHSVHRDTGYHCNQCHSFKAHSFMKTNGTLCNDCHSLKTFVYSSAGLTTRFNHESHAKLGCKECHMSIFQMKKGMSSMTMDSIYQGRYCGACHNGKKAFSTSECTKCHEMKAFKKAMNYRVEGIGDVSFSHEFHTQIYSCDQCHPGTFQMRKTEKKMTMDAINSGKYCGACHNGQSAFAPSECLKCHKTGKT